MVTRLFVLEFIIQGFLLMYRGCSRSHRCNDRGAGELKDRRKYLLMSESRCSTHSLCVLWSQRESESDAKNQARSQVERCSSVCCETLLMGCSTSGGMHASVCNFHCS